MINIAEECLKDIEIEPKQGQHPRAAVTARPEHMHHRRPVAGTQPHVLALGTPGQHPGFRRFIRREPLGVVFVIAAWNYPYLISVNCVIPALLAGASRLRPLLSAYPS